MHTITVALVSGLVVPLATECLPMKFNPSAARLCMTRPRPRPGLEGKCRFAAPPTR